MKLASFVNGIHSARFGSANRNRDKSWRIKREIRNKYKDSRDRMGTPLFFIY